ncbi:MAG: hypothetical protein OEZ41_05975 [Nitrospirota bacterium]|nr:hypothetical protein [Nitrospirota bacterium]MDH5699495.1 hypothetical protein [Nitrospirota bacterium]
MTSQTGGVGIDQAKTTENPANNPFAKIFRNQSAADVLLNSLSNTISGNDEERVAIFESFPYTQAAPGDLLPYLYLAKALKGDEPQGTDDGARQQITGDVAAVETASFPLPAEDGKGSGGVGQIESSRTLIGLLPGSLTQDKSVLGGPSLRPTPSVGNPLVDQSAAPLVTNVDSKQILQHADKSVVEVSVPVAEQAHVKTPDRLLQPAQDIELSLPRSVPPPLETPQGPLKPAANQAFHAPLPFEETPAGLADAVQVSQNRLKYVSGVSSPLSESSASGKESAIGIPPDLLGEVNVSLTGDRSRDGLEATGKAVGIDPNGGQGLNTGMGGSTHSQSGFFHQSSSSPSPGPGVRMAEERVHDLPGPPLQRLQMEVQLSETNRVQIDVGVQHRQVYASLLMDHATLKNLAVQFVPQLEEQLAQGEMELQEFSAEVRDHHGEQESKTQSDRQGTQTSPRGTTSLHQATGSLSNVSIRAEDPGLHLVA